MNRRAQKKFVRELTDSIRNSIFDKIESGKIPETWDGFELRALLADTFKQNAYQMRRARKWNYQNDVLVNNLL